METTAIEKVSQEVQDAAIKYADNSGFKKYSYEWCLVHLAFLAGAAFQKPTEHNQLPNPDDNGNVLGE